MGKVSTFIQGLVSIGLLGAMCYGGFIVYSNLTQIPSSSDISQIGDSNLENTSTTEDAQNEILYRNVQLDNDDYLYFGNLVCVTPDNYTNYNTDSIELCNIYENRISAYAVNSIDDKISTNVINEINTMVADFSQSTENTDTMIRLAYVSPNDLDDYSKCDHVTGLSFNLSSYDGNTIKDYNGAGDFSWISDRADKYGFIQRYPSEKSDITGFDEPSHFRYVGLPHSAYIKENNLCLEEYIEIVKQYTYNSPLEFTTFNGRTYHIYYVTADTSNDTTNVPVLMDKEYSISGDNSNGFIVTVKISG